MKLFSMATTYHGSRNRIDNFDELSLNFLRKGEGGLIHGAGTYLTEQKDVATAYGGYGNFSDAIISINGKKYKFNGRAKTQIRTNDDLRNALLNLGLRYRQLPYFVKDLYWWDDPVAEWDKDLKTADGELKESIEQFKEVYLNNDIYVDKSGLKGVVHTVHLDDNALLMIENERLENQPEVYKLVSDIAEPYETGKQFYRRVSDEKGKLETSIDLRDRGIDGISYFGALDRQCYVIFNNNVIKITDVVVK